VERFNLRKLNKLEVTKYHQIKISNRSRAGTAALKISAAFHAYIYPPVLSNQNYVLVWTLQKNKNLLLLPGIKPQFLRCQVHGLATTPTELSWLMANRNYKK
jgi:hypothetical protein